MHATPRRQFDPAASGRCVTPGTAGVSAKGAGLALRAACGRAGGLLLGCAVAAGCAAQGLASTAAMASANQAVGWAGVAGQDTARALQPAALSLGLSARTRVTFEPQPWQPPTALSAAPGTPVVQARVGLEFKASRADQNVRSLLRVQLAGDSVLHFKPRGGGMTVTYRSNF